MFQRSGDVGLGVPFNIASYSFLTHILAKHCDLEPFEFIYFLGNAHIYDDHLESLEEQVKREPNAFPKIVIDKKCNSIEEYNIGNVNIENYICHETIKMKMRK